MAAEPISIIASDFQTQLSSAISVAGTSFTIQSVTDEDGNDLSDGTYCFTIDRDNSKKEYLIGTLTAATKTVASVSTVSRKGVLTANAARSHRIGANVIISDHSILSSLSKIFRGQGTIDPAAPLAYETDPTLTSSTELATKGYVDSVVTGGTINTDRIIVGSQTAGETVAAGSIVYFKSSDSRWWKTDADLVATVSNVQLGVALGSGTAGNPISGGVQIYGKCDSFTGLTATATYYVSNTAGAVSSSAGTISVVLGQAFSTTGIFFNPDSSAVTAISSTAGVADAGKLIKSDATGLIDKSFTTTPTVVTFTASGTWTKPTGLKYAIVEIIGGGGGGGSVTSSSGAGSGGGAGAYTKKLIGAASLGATETVTIGAGGAANSAGGNSTFGSILTSNGGAASGGDTDNPSAGGAASGGDVNINGGYGKGGCETGSAQSGGRGGDTPLGSGGTGGVGNAGGGGGTGYGSGGGGAATSANSADQTGGSGAGGLCIVTEYYN
jgi:hypothetical protein